MDNYELIYYRNICEIKDDFINERISKTEYEQKMEIERLQFIEYLQRKDFILRTETIREAQTQEFIKSIWVQVIGFKGE